MEIPEIKFKSSAITICNARKSFFQNNEERLDVLNGINLEIKAGEFLAILGPSGCGKSTLLNILARVESLDSGTIEYDLTCRSTATGLIAVAWQEESLMPWKTVRKNIEFPLILADISKGERNKRVEKWISAVGLDGFGDYYPSQLSQGMRRRVSLAAALVSEPQLLLMDEPFSSLDPYMKHQIEKEVVKLWESLDTTIILVTHDVQEAVALSDRIVVLTKRPATVKSIRDNPLPRPRDLDALYRKTEFHEIVRELWLHLTEGNNETTI
jgi:ABC-type nitrate/sulfonate/bicarbonate transport system ATPase subunit